MGPACPQVLPPKPLLQEPRGGAAAVTGPVQELLVPPATYHEGGGPAIPAFAQELKVGGQSDLAQMTLREEGRAPGAVPTSPQTLWVKPGLDSGVSCLLLHS